jgi:hypothetical protein
MSNNAPQIEQVMAGRAILWSDASESGSVPAHVMPTANETGDESTRPRHVTSQTNLITIDPSQNADVVLGVAWVGHAFGADLLASKSAFARTLLPFLILPQPISTQAAPETILTSAATGTPLPSKSILATCRDLLNSRRGLLRPEQFAALLRQINALLLDEDELIANRVVVSAASLDGLIEFIVRHQLPTHPNVAIARNGRFTASWTHGKRAKITLTFDANRVGGEWIGVDLGIQPPARHDGAFIIDSLAGIARPFQSWIKT